MALATVSQSSVIEVLPGVAATAWGIPVAVDDVLEFDTEVLEATEDARLDDEGDIPADDWVLESFPAEPPPQAVRVNSVQVTRSGFSIMSSSR